MSTSGTGPAELPPKQEKLLLALLECRTTEEAAARAGVPLRSAWRMLREDSFRAVLRGHRREALAAATGALIASTRAAVDTLAELAADEKTPAAVRVSASRTLLEYSFRAQEMDDLTARLEGVESTLAGLTEGR